MKHSKYLLLSLLSLILVVLFSSFAFADSTVAARVVENTITSEEKATFELSITNNENVVQSYTIYSLTGGHGWSVDPTPLSDKVIEDLAPNEEYKTTVEAWPLESFEPGIYYVNIIVDSDLGESYEVPLKVYVSSTEPVEYLPAITVDIEMNSEMDAHNVQSVLIHVENGNPLDLSQLEVEVQCEIDAFNTLRQVDLGSLESKTIEFTVELDPFQQPKDYVAFFTFRKEGEIIKVVEEDFEVITQTTPFTYEVVEESVFLKKYQAFNLENTGNVENTQTFFYPVSDFAALFLKSDAAIDERNGQKYLSWEITLEPQEETYVNAIYNYRILFYIGVFFVLLLLFYLFVRSPIAVHKGAVTTEGKEGALHEIKIALEVKNKTRKSINDVNVTDVIPGIANLEKCLDLGTLKPQQVLNTKQGTKIVWNLPELEAKEHRIITYKIRTKLNVLGTFKLPRAVVEFKKKKGKVKKAYSNLFRLDAGRIDQS